MTLLDTNSSYKITEKPANSVVLLLFLTKLSENSLKLRFKIATFSLSIGHKNTLLLKFFFSCLNIQVNSLSLCSNGENFVAVIRSLFKSKRRDNRKSIEFHKQCSYLSQFNTTKFGIDFPNSFHYCSSIEF